MKRPAKQTIYVTEMASRRWAVKARWFTSAFFDGMAEAIKHAEYQAAKCRVKPRILVTNRSGDICCKGGMP